MSTPPFLLPLSTTFDHTPNEIELVFKQVKYHEIPRRSHPSQAELQGSVEQAFHAYRQQLRPKR